MVGRLPQGRQPNLWRHFTRFNSTASRKITISQLSTHRYWSSFWWCDAFPRQPVRIREKHLESGNLFSGSSISTSVPCFRLQTISQFISDLNASVVFFRPGDSLKAMVSQSLSQNMSDRTKMDSEVRSNDQYWSTAVICNDVLGNYSLFLIVL